MKRIYNKYKSGKGFTLLEMLIVVGILVVLMGITIVSLLSLRKSLRQKQLDYCAELIYMAAQNQLVELSIEADNYDTVYGPTVAGVTAMNYVPEGTEYLTLDNGDGTTTTYPTTESLYYTCSWTEGENTAKKIVPSSVISPEIWSGDWVIEYAPNEAFIYAVYYSESVTDGKSRVQDYSASSSSDFAKNLRSRDGRLVDGAQVGYYGGDAAVDFEYQTLEPHVVVYNEEELVAYISCVSLDKKALSFDVVVSDGENEMSVSPAPTVTQIGQNRWVAVVVLDGLENDADRFCNQFPELTPGANLTLTVTVSGQSKFVDSEPVIQNTLTQNTGLDTDKTYINSLYDSVTTDAQAGNIVANIRTARHLQNLDAAAYDTHASTITKANLLNDISFLEDETEVDNDFEEEWYTLYSNQKFDPITCDSLTIFEGNNFRIIGLQPKGTSTSNTGLFADISSDLTIQNLTLTGTSISAGQYAGALAGRISGGNVTVSNCHVILDTQTDLAKVTAGDNWPTKTWISASYAGGLIGGIVGTSTNVSIVNSLAATVVGKTGTATGAARFAGGLVGYCAGQLDVNYSYASCYLGGQYTGALVGYSNNNARIDLTNCYAAGYQLASTRAAGLVNGPLRNATSVYTVTRYTTTEGTASTVSTLSTAKSLTGSLKNVFYLFAGTDTTPLSGSSKLTYDQATGKVAVNEEGDTLTELLGDSFSRTPTNTSVPYNLLDQGLNTYSYPSLKSMAHYGDWYAEFENGSLVYYEEYADGTYGYYGANANTLKDQVVVGDGYGLIYEGTTPKGIVRVTYPISATSTNTVDLTKETTSGGKTSYGANSDVSQYITLNAADSLVLLTLPKSLLNTTYAASDYWQKITVVGARIVEEIDINGDSEVYYFNPHFARLVEGPYDKDATTPDLPQTVYLRSARQLYNLSLYYSNYKSSQSGQSRHVYLFTQPVDIDYKAYKWYNYTSFVTSSDEKITAQHAIGYSSSGYVDFTDNYDGECNLIYGLSFTSDSSAGFIANNTGRLLNIRLADNVGRNCTLALNGQNLSGTVYAGILAAQNSGNIDNCAVAGYNIVINAYQNSDIYCGGLVGRNTGSITNSSAVCPVIQLTTHESNVRIGGFVSANDGRITGCYAINSLKQVENTNTTGKTVVLAGFCAKNGPRIANSYTLSAFDITGQAEKYSFSPSPSAGMTLQNCYYLSGGTFRFAGSTFSYKKSAGGGTPIGYSDLKSLNLTGFGSADSDSSYVHAYTTGLDSDATFYPFPTSLTNADNVAAHYGDWVIGITSDKAGVFYWEYESGGDDEGYHISLVSDNSNLCDNHDDGGVITAYGYGYFTKGNTSATLTMDSNFATGAVENTTVSGALASLMPGYTFHAYDSLSQADITNGTKSGKLYLTTEERNGVWTLAFDGTTVPYYVCPFFGDAFMVKATADSDATYLPGNEKEPYQIRSIDQLQFINWNYVTCNCKTDVTAGKDNTAVTYKNFPYLQYATVTEEASDNNKQSLAAVNNTGRTKQYWEQTHDIGSSAEDTEFWPIAGTSTGSTDEEKEIILVTYLQGNLNAVLYTWFGGSYDGGSYKITNLSISSTLNNIGVFGYTCGADMKNVILYSNLNSVIERVPDLTHDFTVEVGLLGRHDITMHANGNDSYAIGSLIGIAYDYDGHSTGTISNCAVAGYRIEDHSENQRISCGDVNIGGLFGIANANIVNCSSVVDILVDTTFEYFSCLGNTVRAGGIAGCCNYKLLNCYSGGSISLGENAVAGIEGTGTRAKQQNGFNVIGLGHSGGDFYYTYYHFAGICAGNFGGNFMNFTGRGDFEYGGDSGLILTANKLRNFFNTNITQTFENCYTYMEIDTVEGYRNDYDYDTGVNKNRSYLTIGRLTWETSTDVANIGVKTVMAIGGVPETLSDASAWLSGIFSEATGGTTINNCWYLESCINKPNYSSFEDNDGFDLTWKDYALGRRSTHDSIKNSDSMSLEFMYDGQLQAKLSTATTTVTVNNISYPGYQSVTTYENPLDDTENGQYVGGKYSFPGKNAQLKGTVFPYPSIITQTNSYGETVHVHYGEWQTGLLMFEEYYVDIDLLRDNQTVTLTLTAEGDARTDVNPALSFKDENGDTSTLLSADYTCEKVDDSTWRYTITANGTGTVYVTAETTSKTTKNTISADCQVNITADISLSAQAITLADGTETGFGGYVNQDIVTVAFDATFTSDDGDEIDLRAYEETVGKELLHWTVDISAAEDQLSFYHTSGTSYNKTTAARELRLNNGNTVWGTIFDLVGEGNALVTLKLEYAMGGWNGNEPIGPLLTEECRFSITVWTPTVFGIAVTEGETPLYKQISHCVPTTTPTAEAASYSAGAEPRLSDSTLYFYTSGTEANLADFLGGTVTVTDTAGNPVNEENYYLELPTADQIVRNGDYQLAPIVFNSVAGDYVLNYTVQKVASCLQNGTVTDVEYVTYTIPITISRGTASELTATFEAVLPDGTVGASKSVPVAFKGTVSANVADDLALPEYYHYAADSAWLTEDKTAPGTALLKDTTYQRALAGDEYTFNFVYTYKDNEETVTKTLTNTYTYGIDSGLALFEELFPTSPHSFYGWSATGTETIIIQDGEALAAALDALEAAGVNIKTTITLTAKLTPDPTPENNSENPGSDADASEEVLSSEEVTEETTEEPTLEPEPTLESEPTPEPEENILEENPESTEMTEPSQEAETPAESEE